MVKVNNKNTRMQLATIFRDCKVALKNWIYFFAIKKRGKIFEIIDQVDWMD